MAGNPAGADEVGGTRLQNVDDGSLVIGTTVLFRQVSVVRVTSKKAKGVDSRLTVREDAERRLRAGDSTTHSAHLPSVAGGNLFLCALYFTLGSRGAVCTAYAARLCPSLSVLVSV